MGNQNYIFVIAAFLALISIVLLLERINEKIKKTITYYFIIFSPIIVFASILAVFRRLPLIIAGEAGAADFFTYFGLLLLLSFYAIMGIAPNNLAYLLVNTYRDFLHEKRNVSAYFWTMVEKIKSNRFIWKTFLITGVFFVGFLDLTYIIAFYGRHSTNYITISLALAVIIVFLAAIIFILDYFFSGSINIKRARHKKEVELDRIVETLSITAGISKPKVEILKNDQPTAFSFYLRGHAPTIFFTVGLLNLLDKKELEGVAAHEISHLSSGLILDYRRMNILTDLLKTLSAILFLLFLASLNAYLVFVWLVFIAYISLHVISKKSSSHSSIHDITDNIYIAFTLLNPPYLLANFISQVIYFSIAYNEDFYADLNAITLTRRPEGIYSALKKIKNHKKSFDFMPHEYSYLYFSAEVFSSKRPYPPLPETLSRIRLLEQIEKSLKNFKIKKIANFLPCPYCQSAMKECQFPGNYGYKTVIDVCGRCGSVWFDKYEVYLLADLKLLKKHYAQILPAYVNPGLKPHLGCPRCGVELQLIQDDIIPSDVKMYACPECLGNFLAKKDLISYYRHKNKNH